MIQAAVAYLLLMSMGGISFLDRAIYGEWFGKTGDSLTAAMNLVSMAASLFLFVAGLRKNGSPRFKQLLPFAAIGFFFLSAVWSFEPVETVKRATNYFVMVIGAMGIAQTLHANRFMKVVVWVCSFAAFASLALLAASPGLATQDLGGICLRGVFGHKNMMAQAMAAGILASLYCIRTEAAARTRYVLLTGVFMVFAVAARSSTALLVIGSYLLLLTIMALYFKGGTTRFLSFCVLALAGVAAIVLVFDPDVLFEVLGKDPTLTGRTDLWPFVIAYIGEKPLLGWGYAGFWTPANLAVQEITKAIGWDAPEAHNGPLEFLIQLGFAGTALFAWLIIRNGMLAVRCLALDEREFGISSLLFIAGLMVMAVSEAILLSPGEVQTLLFFTMGFICERAVDTALARRRAAPRRRGIRLIAADSRVARHAEALSDLARAHPVVVKPQ